MHPSPAPSLPEALSSGNPLSSWSQFPLGSLTLQQLDALDPDPFVAPRGQPESSKSRVNKIGKAKFKIKNTKGSRSGAVRPSTSGGAAVALVALRAASSGPDDTD